ncbi:hypothetical protein ACOI1A_00855 [Corynebacterium glutamicum]|uniref:hypothetical protein n=1 Tax=Corynebacterium glutamicum TaxID=1718 RepID=UPI003B5C44C6
MTFTIEQLEALKEGITSGPWEWYWDQGIISLRGAGGEPIATDLTVADSDMIAASPALLGQLIATEAELQQLKVRIENLADWHDIKAMKARDFPWPGEQHAARFRGKAEAHETARDKLTQILEDA